MRKLLLILLALAVPAGCTAHRKITDKGVIMRRIAAQMTRQYHQCVPLGWTPVPVIASYYRGYSAHILGEGYWLPPMWAVSISDRAAAKKPEAASIRRLLNDLVARGMVSRERSRSGYDYHLTMHGIRYFYASNRYGDNVEGWPYLCYSTIVPTHILWAQKVHPETVGDDGAKQPVFRAAFDWQSSAPAEWARNDAIVRAHTVILAPTTSPTIAKFVDWDGDWEIAHIYSRGTMLPTIPQDDTDVSAIPGARGGYR